jgi:hypothetical protein
MDSTNLAWICREGGPVAVQMQWLKSQVFLPSRGGLNPLNYYQKAEPDDTEALFQLGTIPWEQAGSEMINEVMQAFAFAPESESHLTNYSNQQMH